MTQTSDKSNFFIAEQRPSVVLIGPYPPPYGGVSVHLQRMLEYLQDEGADCTIYNGSSAAEIPGSVVSVSHRRVLWFLGFCLSHRCQLVNLHYGNWLSALIFALASRWRNGKHVFSVHNDDISEVLGKPLSFRVWLTRWLLRQMDMIITSNPKIEQDFITRAGVSPKKICAIPAFIPANVERAPEPPEYIQQYVQTHDPLLSATGFLGDSNWRRVYGFDNMLCLVRRLRKDYPSVGLILSVNGGTGEAAAETVRECREVAGDSILVVTESLPDMSRILQSSTLLVRPTTTDGDAVSVREALCLGTPVVASDAAPRPDACVLFRTSDMDDFEAKVRQALSDLQALEERVRACEMPSNGARILQVYRQLLEGI